MATINLDMDYSKKRDAEDKRLKDEQQKRIDTAGQRHQEKVDYYTKAKADQEAMLKNQQDAQIALLAAQRDTAAEQLMNQVTRQKEDNENAYQDSARQANIQRMQAQRDLPQRLAAQGVSGGLSESGNIALRTEYGNNLASFKNTRDSANANADQAYNDAILGVNNTYNQGELAAKAAYDEGVAKALADYNAGILAADDTYSQSLDDINTLYGTKIQENQSYYEQLMEQQAAERAAQLQAAQKARYSASTPRKSSDESSDDGNSNNRLKTFIDGLSNISDRGYQLNYLRQMQLRGLIDDADFSWLANNIVGVTDDYVNQFFANQASQGRPYMTSGEWNNYLNSY